VSGACRASKSENRSTTAREQSPFHHSCGYRRAYQALPNRRLIGSVAQQHGEHNREDLQSVRHRKPHSRARQSTRLVLATYPVSFYAPHLSPSPSPATRTIPQQKSTRYPFHCLILYGPSIARSIGVWSGHIYVYVFFVLKGGKHERNRRVEAIMLMTR
jgi:hypothetical protein